MKQPRDFLATMTGIVVVGLVIGAFAVSLQKLGNPPNMGICVACFTRDIAGALGLHRAGIVQYLRPEIPAFCLGSLLAALVFREFRPRTGSAPVIRFVLGMFAMIGAASAAFFVSTAAGLIIGFLAQRTRFCTVGGIRDVILMRDFHLLSGVVAFFVAAFVLNLICLRIHANSIPFLPGAEEYADQWLFPAGTARNKHGFHQRVRVADGVIEEVEQLLYTPETPGGLIAAIPPDRLDGLKSAFDAAQHALWVVGVITPAGDHLIELEP